MPPPRLLITAVRTAAARSLAPFDSPPELISQVLELVLDAARDLAREALRARIVHLAVLDHDAHLAPGLDGVRLLDPGNAFAIFSSASRRLM